jgi:hypothetical protein
MHNNKTRTLMIIRARRPLSALTHITNNMTAKVNLVNKEREDFQAQ